MMRSAFNRSLAIAAVASVGGCGWVTYRLLFYNPPADWAQHVVPHGPLVELAPNLWQVTGRVDAHSDALMRNMVIYRIPRSTFSKKGRREENNKPELLLHSVISLSDEGMNEIDKLGKVRYILVPSPFHRLDAAVYKQRYPDAEVICPQDIRNRVSKVVPVDATVENVFHRRDVSTGIKCYVPGDGLYFTELVYELPLGKKEGSQEGPTEKALVFCDLLTNVKSGPLNVRALGIVTGGEYPVVPWFTRYVVSRDSSKMKRFWETLAQRNDISVLAMAHGEPVVGPAEVKKRLKKIAADY